MSPIRLNRRRGSRPKLVASQAGARLVGVSPRKPRLATGERPRDEFGRPLPWGSESKLELLDYDSLSVEENEELAIDYFNRRQFFPAHEAWEAAWRKVRGTPEEEFFNGLAKLGAGLTHIQRGNAHGALTLIGKARRRIASYGPAHRGIDVTKLARDLDALAGSIAAAARDRRPPPEVEWPQIRRVP